MDTARDPMRELRADLRRLRAAAGQPSLESLKDHAERAGETLPTSTSHDLLNGTRLARWRTVQTFVLTCRRYAERHRLPVDDSFDLAAIRRTWERAARPVTPKTEISERSTSDGASWYFSSFRSVLRLTGPTPSVLEDRALVCLSGVLTGIGIKLSLPRTDESGEPRHLLAELLWGGELVRVEHPSRTTFTFRIRFPRPVHAGESYSLGLRLEVPPGQPMVPYYTFSPLHRCDRFELIAKFPLATPPRTVWRISEVPLLAVEDDEMHTEKIEPDSSGEIRLAFAKPRTGLAYGIYWCP